MEIIIEKKARTAKKGLVSELTNKAPNIIKVKQILIKNARVQGLMTLESLEIIDLFELDFKSDVYISSVSLELSSHFL